MRTSWVRDLKAMVLEKNTENTMDKGSDELEWQKGEMSFLAIGCGIQVGSPPACGIDEEMSHERKAKTTVYGKIKEGRKYKGIKSLALERK